MICLLASYGLLLESGIAIYTIENILGYENSRVLPFFLALTGCDNKSSFSSAGMKTAFFMLNSTEPEISTALKKLKYRQIKKFLALSLSDDVFMMLVNVKMPTIVGILTLMSGINFVLS